MRALVVANSDDRDPGVVGEHLVSRGYQLERWNREGSDPAPVPDHDLVVLLGSDWSVYDPARALPVERECELVRTALDEGGAVFAICYGAQLATVALGGSVSRLDRAEIGWHHVGSTHEHIADGPWLQWHQDVCTVPPGAELLAANAVGPQAYRYGRLFATQFHPEGTPEIVRRWCSDGGRALARVGLDSEQFVARSLEVAPVAESNARRLVDWFCEEVAQ